MKDNLIATWKKLPSKDKRLWAMKIGMARITRQINAEKTINEMQDVSPFPVDKDTANKILEIMTL